MMSMTAVWLAGADPLDITQSGHEPTLAWNTHPSPPGAERTQPTHRQPGPDSSQSHPVVYRGESLPRDSANAPSTFREYQRCGCLQTNGGPPQTVRIMIGLALMRHRCMCVTPCLCVEAQWHMFLDRECLEVIKRHLWGRKVTGSTSGCRERQKGRLP
jgi:hypothetical protein